MIAALLPVVLFASSVIGTPGPANIAIMGASARFGLRRAMPFVLGVICGKQAIIWPMGFGLLQMADAAPMLFLTLKILSATYMIYLAWRIAGMSLGAPGASERVPGFLAGLIVHPLNPKAWALIAVIFTTMIPDFGSSFKTTLVVAIILFVVQLILQPLWGYLGEFLAKRLQGTAERAFFIALAVIMLISIAMAFWGAQSAIPATGA